MVETTVCREQRQGVLKPACSALRVNTPCGVGAFCAFLTALSAVVLQQTYVQGVRRPTEDSLKSENMTAFSSVFPCTCVLECLCLVRGKMACGGEQDMVVRSQGATSLLGSAVKMVCLTLLLLLLFCAGPVLFAGSSANFDSPFCCKRTS